MELVCGFVLPADCWQTGWSASQIALSLVHITVTEVKRKQWLMYNAMLYWAEGLEVETNEWKETKYSFTCTLK